MNDLFYKYSHCIKQGVDYKIEDAYIQSAVYTKKSDQSIVFRFFQSMWNFCICVLQSILYPKLPGGYEE